MARVLNNNTANFIAVGDKSALRLTGALTIVGWAKFATAVGNQFQMNIDNGANSNNQAYTLQTDVVSAAFRIKPQTANGTSVSTLNGSAVLSTATWYHLAFTYDGANGRAFVNGVLDAGPTAMIAPGGYTGTPKGLTLGKYFANVGGSVAPMNGSLADAAIWSTNLSAAEIASLAGGQRPFMVRSKSLIFWSPLDGLQSPEPDLSGNAFNGTINGTVTADTGPPVAPFTPRGQPILLPVEGISGARSFNGSTDQINCGTGVIAPTPAVSLSVWLKPTTFVPAVQTPYSRDITGSIIDSIYQINLLSSGHLSYVVKCGPNLPNVTGPATLSIGTWYQAGLSYDSVNGIKGFLNGVADGTAVANGNLNTGTASTTTIGYDSGNAGRNFAGSIGECGVWNVVLTPSEWKALSQGARPNTIRPSALLHWMPLSGLQSPEPDLSSFRNNGTVIGTTPAPGPPIMPFTPRWPLNTDVVAAPSFNPAWRVPFNQVVSGGVAT